MYSYNTDGVTGPRLRTPQPAGRKTKDELCEITLGCRNQKTGNKKGIIQEQKKKKLVQTRGHRKQIHKTRGEDKKHGRTSEGMLEKKRERRQRQEVEK